MTEELNLQMINEARERIAPYILRTPLLRTEKLDELTGCEVYVKPENLQITGSFKIRGAFSKILTLTDQEKSRGVIASSAGNHAQGVAYAGKILNIPATLVMPVTAPKMKVENTKAYGAQVIQYGVYSEERWDYCYRLAEEKGYTVVHSFNDPLLMAGQGTIGCEIMEDLKEVETVIVPLGGGGLLSGIAAAVKLTNPEIRVIGAEPANCDKYYRSRIEGKPVEVPLNNTVADGLKLNRTGPGPYPLIEKYVDEIIPVEELFIETAVRMLAAKAKLVAEPSGAIGLGALLCGKLKVRQDEKVCILISGGNWDMDRLAEIYLKE